MYTASYELTCSFPRGRVHEAQVLLAKVSGSIDGEIVHSSLISLLARDSALLQDAAMSSLGVAMAHRMPGALILRNRSCPRQP